MKHTFSLGLFADITKSPYLLQMCFHSIRFKVQQRLEQGVALFMSVRYVLHIYLKIYNKAVSLQQNRKTNDEPNITIT